jgi:hypothetical protein
MVGAIEDDVVVGDDADGVLKGEVLSIALITDVGVESGLVSVAVETALRIHGLPLQVLDSTINLPLTNRVGVMQYLPMKI